MKRMNYESALEAIEGNSCYNVYVLLMLSVMTFMASVDLNSLVFLGYSPNFKCVDDSIKGINVTWKKDQCHGVMMVGNLSRVTFFCSRWDFDRTVMKRSLVTDFALVCDKAYLVTLLDTVFFVGIAIGGFLGVGGDWVGRRKFILVGVLLEILINIALPLTTNLWAVLILRFLWGFGMAKLFQGVVYIAEISTISRRSIYTNNFWIFYVVGYMSLPGVAYGLRDWRSMRHFCNIPMILYISYLWIPESPRWLSVLGREKEAKEVLAFIARKNGISLTSTDFNNLKSDVEKNVGVKEVFRTKEMRKKILVLAFAHSAISLCYFGLSINAHFVTKDIFLNVFLQGIVEILTGPLGWISTTKWNRRISMTFFLVLTGMCLIASTLTPATTMPLTVTKAFMAMLGKFCLTTGYCISDMYLTEVFPTVVRNTASFIILGTASLATVLSPSINNLDIFSSFLSTALYSTMIVLSAVLIFFMLPETKGCPLPQTILDADQLRRGNEKMFCRVMLDKDFQNNTKL